MGTVDSRVSAEIRVRLRRQDAVASEPSEWTPTQASVLEHRAGGLLVLGGPGTGKTSLAVAAAARNLAEGRQALVLTINRQEASRVRDRVTALSGRTSFQPSVMTIHALSRTLLHRFAVEPGSEPRLLTAPEQELRIREVLGGRGASAWPDSLSQAYSTRGFARQVRAAIARARQLGFDPEDVTLAAERAGDAYWDALGAFMAEYLDVMDAEQAIDYSELVHRARLLLELPEVAAEVRAWFDAIWIDEVPELDPAQLALVRAIAADDVPVVGLGDPDSSIFRFRGAHPRAAAEFQRLFGARVVTLAESFRLSKPMVRAVAGVASRLPLPLGGGLGAGFREPTGSGDGPALVWTFPGEAAQASGIAAELRRAHLESGLPWSQMAVLVRSGSEQIARLVRALVHSGVPVDVAGDEIGLGSDPAVRPLLTALEVASSGRCSPDQALGLLTSGWGGFDSVELRVLGRALSAPGAAGRVAELAAEVLSGQAPPPEGGSGRARGLLARLASRAQLLRRARQAIDEGGSAEDALWILWSGTAWPAQLRGEALGSTEGSRAAHRDLDAVVALFGLASDLATSHGHAGVRAFLAEVAGRLLPADLERESAVSGVGVRVMTAHRAKGRQWRLVVVAGVQEGSWPNVRIRGALFDPERLTTSGLAQPGTIGELLATERRLFHLACTRASDRLIITAVEGSDDESAQPSRFLAELGVSPTAQAGPGLRLTTLRELVASLRAAAEDAEADPGLRQAAVDRLARLAGERDDSGRPLVPDADPDRWWGVLPLSSDPVLGQSGQIRLSPSRLAALLACPRQYFLGRRVKADSATPQMALGSVLHSLLEQITRHDLGVAEAVALLDEVWGSIPFAAPWLAESEHEAAVATIKRFVDWRNARANADVVGVEVPFSFDLEVDGEAVQIVGQADRVERDASGALRVIDFKSSKRVVSAADAKSHDQLGLYQLAIQSGAFEGCAAGARNTAGADLVFIRVDSNGMPAVRSQPSLDDVPHLADGAEQAASPTWVHQRVAQAVSILKAGRFDAIKGEQCNWCSFKSSCPLFEEGRQELS